MWNSSVATSFTSTLARLLASSFLLQFNQASLYIDIRGPMSGRARDDENPKKTIELMSCFSPLMVTSKGNILTYVLDWLGNIRSCQDSCPPVGIRIASAHARISGRYLRIRALDFEVLAAYQIHLI